jgi:hypothetical protein
MVVECQVSPIDPYEWRRRTADYARNGIPVMWVWDARRIPLKTAVHDVTDVEIHEARVPQEILYAAGCGHTLYVADAVGTLRLLRLQEVFRECSMCDGVGTTEWGDCEYCGGEGGRDLKMTKEVDQFGMPRQFGAFEEHRFTNLRFAHIDLRTAVDEERPDWLSLLTRVQVEPESGTP